MPVEIAFGILAAFTLFGGVAAVASRNLFRAALGLMLSLLGVAGLFLLQNAQFLAAVQVLVFAGGIAVLIVYAVALLEKPGEPLTAVFNRLAPVAGITGSLLSIIVVVAIWKSSEGSSPPAAVPARFIGQVFLNQLLVPFEALSLLLLSALVGALLVARAGGEGKN
jgi:NADH-quinone oxidoreductase subunit J